MRRKFHRLILLPGDVRVWIHPSFHDFFMLRLKTSHIKYKNLGGRCGTVAASPPGPSWPTFRQSGSNRPLLAGCYCWDFEF